MTAEVRVEVIKDEQRALELLKQALDGQIAEDESIIFRFEGWPKFTVNVKGERYHSTVPTQLMRALVDYQNSFNKFYAGAVYGKTAKSLTDDDRNSSELVFQVHEGSSDIWAALAQNLNGFAEKMVDRMTGGQLVATVLGLALLASGTFGYKAYLDHDTATMEEKGRQQLEQQLIANSQAARQASEQFAMNAVEIIKSVSDAREVTVGSEHFSSAAIKAVTEKSRATWEKKRIDGTYRVVSLKRLKDRWAIRLVNDGTGQEIRTDLYRGEAGSEAIHELSVAFASDKPLQLYVIAGVSGDRVSQARILGTKKTGYGVAHAEEPAEHRRDS